MSQTKRTFDTVEDQPSASYNVAAATRNQGYAITYTETQADLPKKATNGTTYPPVTKTVTVNVWVPHISDLANEVASLKQAIFDSRLRRNSPIPPHDPFRD